MINLNINTEFFKFLMTFRKILMFHDFELKFLKLKKNFLEAFIFFSRHEIHITNILSSSSLGILVIRI